MPSDESDAATNATPASTVGASANTSASGRDPASVFALLSDETRVGIVRELASADGPVAFAVLCERVGIEDSGRFNYHLGKLRGSLVEKAEDGYVLTDAGRTLAATTAGIEPIAQ